MSLPISFTVGLVTLGRGKDEKELGVDDDIAYHTIHT